MYIYAVYRQNTYEIKVDWTCYHEKDMIKPDMPVNEYHGITKNQTYFQENKHIRWFKVLEAVYLSKFVPWISSL